MISLEGLTGRALYSMDLYLDSRDSRTLLTVLVAIYGLHILRKWQRSRFVHPIPPEFGPGGFFSNLGVKPRLGSRSRSRADSCQVCHNLTLTGEDKKVSVQEAKFRASNGCLGCKLIVCAFKQYVYKEDSWKKFALMHRAYHWLKLPYKGHSATIELCNQFSRIITIKLDEKLSALPRTYNIFTMAEVNDVQNGFGIQEGYMLQDYSGSIESFNMISSWLQNCMDNHKDCAQSDTSLPTRVLDISHPDKIILRSGEGRSGRYCALSHCWGPRSKKPLKTTKATLKSHHSYINEGSLSKTFRHAITLARYLSISYIWIDSLCIIQDDKEDWARESIKMAAIYGNACLVIAATHAKHGGEGCFAFRKSSNPAPCLTLPQENGQVASVYVRLKPRHNDFSPTHTHTRAPDERRFPLLSRAWCLQERLLATRILHFTQEEMFWECKTTTVCECGSLPLTRRDPTLQERWAKDHELPKLFDLWHKTVELYSNRRLSYETDRFPALSGLAKSLQTKGCGDYVAGVWVKNVLAELMWYSLPSKMGRPAKWKAPSWSWACREYDGIGIRFKTQNYKLSDFLIDVERLRGADEPSKTSQGKLFRTTFVLVDTAVNELNGPNIASEIPSPILTISAPAITLSLTLHAGIWKLQKAGKWITSNPVNLYLDSPTDDFEGRETAQQGVYLLCAWIGTVRKLAFLETPWIVQLLLLQPSRGLGGKAAALGCYERVGVFYGLDYVKGQYATILAWFEDAEVREIGIV